MKVICPYTSNRLNPKTKAALPSSTDYVEMTDFDSYQQLFARLWQSGQTFILVEHDVLPAPGALDQLAACSHDWCSCPYGSGAASLGCVKVSDSLIAKLPGIWEQMPLRHWQYCDHWFNSHAELVAQVHRHSPVEAHLHVNNDIVASGPLVKRVRRQTADEIEIAFYDPAIEYEFAAVTLPRSKLTDAEIAERVDSELTRLNSQLNQAE